MGGCCPRPSAAAWPGSGARRARAKRASVSPKSEYQRMVNRPARGEVTADDGASAGVALAESYEISQFHRV